MYTSVCVSVHVCEHMCVCMYGTTRTPRSRRVPEIESNSVPMTSLKHSLSCTRKNPAHKKRKNLSTNKTIISMYT